MTINQAKQYFNSYVEDFPERALAIGANLQPTDDKLKELIYVAEQVWLGFNYSEQQAFEKALQMSRKY